MNFLEAVKSGFRNYANFNGRATRSEYWFWHLFVFLGVSVAMALDLLVFQSAMFPISGIFMLATLVPDLSVIWRRLHDRDRSGAWFFISITGLGTIILIVWFLLPGTVGDNRFGPDPLRNSGGSTSENSGGTTHKSESFIKPE